MRSQRQGFRLQQSHSLTLGFLCSQKHKIVLSQSENVSTYSTIETHKHLVSLCSVQGYHMIEKTERAV